MKQNYKKNPELTNSLIVCYLNTAVELDYVNKRKEAIEIYTEAIEISQNYLGLKHALTTVLIENLNKLINRRSKSIGRSYSPNMIPLKTKNDTIYERPKLTVLNEIDHLPKLTESLSVKSNKIKNSDQLLMYKRRQSLGK